MELSFDFTRRQCEIFDKISTLNFFWLSIRVSLILGLMVYHPFHLYAFSVSQLISRLQYSINSVYQTQSGHLKSREGLHSRSNVLHV